MRHCWHFIIIVVIFITIPWYWYGRNYFPPLQMKLLWFRERELFATNKHQTKDHLYYMNAFSCSSTWLRKSYINNLLSFLPNLRVRRRLQKIRKLRTLFYWNVKHPKKHLLVIGLYLETQIPGSFQSNWKNNLNWCLLLMRSDLNLWPLKYHWDMIKYHGIKFAKVS